MSAYITLMTPMVDQDCLLSALADLGFDQSRVEVHAQPVQLEGYMGDRRVQTANIVIRRKYVGGASNDVGFLATSTGYQAYVSGYDHPRFGTSWLGQLTTRYQYHDAIKQERLAAEERQRQEEERKKLVEAQRASVYEKAKKLGYMVKESREGETLRLVLVKRSY